MPTFREDIRLGTKVPQMKTEDYEDASVTTEKIADKAITESKLAEHAVTSSILGNGAVENSNIKDGSITNEKIANRTIKAFEKIARGTISQEELGSFSVGDDEIIDGSVTTEKIADEAVVIGKIAAEVWSKIKDEYLRVDGDNGMTAALNMGGNTIIRVGSIVSNFTPNTFIRFLDSQVSIGAFDDEDHGVSIPQWVTIWRDSSFYGSVEAAGFKTKDRSTLGLLNNNSEVITAMTDSDIDSCIASVFA